MPKYSDPGEKVVSIAHNIFIEVAAELGIPALIVFVAFFIACVLGLGRVKKMAAAPEIVRGAAGALQAGVLGFCVAGCFVSAEYQKTTWMGLALVPCIIALSRSRETRQTQEEEFAAVKPRESKMMTGTSDEYV